MKRLLCFALMLSLLLLCSCDKSTINSISNDDGTYLESLIEHLGNDNTSHSPAPASNSSEVTILEINQKEKEYDIITLTENNYHLYIGFNVYFSDFSVYENASSPLCICNMHIETFPLQPGVFFKSVKFRYDIDEKNVLRAPSKYIANKWTTQSTEMYDLTTQLSYDGHSVTSICITNTAVRLYNPYPNTTSSFISITDIVGYVCIEK